MVAERLLVLRGEASGKVQIEGGEACLLSYGSQQADLDRWEYRHSERHADEGDAKGIARC